MNIRNTSSNTNRQKALGAGANRHQVPITSSIVGREVDASPVGADVSSATRRGPSASVCAPNFPILYVVWLTRDSGCRKGKRDCVYPEPSPTHKSASSQKSKNANPSEEDDDTDDSLLTTIPDEDGAITVNISQHSKQFKRGLRRTSTLSSLNLKRLITGTRQSSETPSLDDIQSPSPIISSTSVTSTPTNASISDLLFATEPDWSHLPSDFRAGLDYFRDNITYWNYVRTISCFKFPLGVSCLVSGVARAASRVICFMPYSRSS